MKDRRVGLNSTKGKVYSSGVGQICIPPEVDRDTFVQTCLTTGYVSVQPSIGGAKHRVRCDNWVLQRINFPANSEEFGSYVVYVNDPYNKYPHVIAHFNSLEEYNNLKEHQFKIEKSTDNATVNVVGDGKGSTLALNVISNVDKQGRLDVTIVNPDESAKLNVNIKGTANVYASGKVHVTTNDEILLEATDGKDSSTISITKDRINNDGGAEPMLLGQTTIDLLQELINLISTGVIMGMPLSTAGNIGQLAVQLNGLLSEKSNLD